MNDRHLEREIEELKKNINVIDKLVYIIKTLESENKELQDKLSGRDDIIASLEEDIRELTEIKF